MRRKLIVGTLLLALVLNICACAQSMPIAPEEEEKSEETAPVVENTVEGEPVTQEQAEEPEEEPATEKAEPTEEEKALAEFMGVEELPDLTPEEYEALVVLMETERDTAEYMEKTQQTVPPAKNSAEKPVVDPETGLTQRSDAEVKETINEFVDNFKNTSTFNNLDDVAAKYVDENLNTLKNNPKSNETISTHIESYKNGALTEEEFIYLIESWIRIGGPYGGQNITVQ